MPEITPADINAVNRLNKSCGSLRSDADLTTLLQVAFAAHREAERERIVRMLDTTIEHFWKLNAEHSGNAEQELFTTGAITALGIVKQAIVEPAKLAELAAALGISEGVES